MKNKLFIASFILNILVFLLVVTGIILMFTIGSGALADTSLSVFKYFTFQSNLFMGVVAFVYAYYQLLIIRKKSDKLPHVLLVFNHVGVTAVSLTFIIVILFLAPGYGFNLMYNGANLFFHGIVPVVAMVNYMFIEKECAIKFKDTLFSMIPPIIYGLVYFIVVASMNGYGNINIDFYLFGKDGPFIGALYYLAIVAIAYAFGLLVYFINHLVFKKR